MGQWVAETTGGEPDKSIEQGTAPPLNPRETDEESWLEVDPGEAMVEGVKSGGVSCFLLHEL